MTTMTKPFLSLTAANLMSSDLVTVPRQMSLRKAAHLLAQAHVSGAPVIDGRGLCVGVISANDFVQWAEGQKRPRHFGGTSCACSDWQMMDAEQLPEEAVGAYMTPDPVTVLPNFKITELARMMLDAHIHRVIVVDENNRPVGVVSSMDVLAAVAYAADAR